MKDYEDIFSSSTRTVQAIVDPDAERARLAIQLLTGGGGGTNGEWGKTATAALTFLARYFEKGCKS